jgi:hypothetical protein
VSSLAYGTVRSVFSRLAIIPTYVQKPTGMVCTTPLAKDVQGYIPTDRTVQVLYVGYHIGSLLSRE